MTDPETPSNETRDVDIRGRIIVVRQLQDAQMMLLGREARLARKPDIDPERRLTAVARIFDILESAVLSDDDKDYLMDLNVAGDLTLADMTGFMSAFGDGDEGGEKPKVRRGRAPTKRR